MNSIGDRLNQATAYFSSGWRKKVIAAAFIALSLFVISQIIIFNWDEIESFPWEFRPLWLLLTAFFFLIDFFIVLFCWHLLIVRLGNFNNFRTTARIYLTSNLAKRIPGGVWYLASRTLLYAQETGVGKRITTLISGLEIAFFITSGIITTLLTLPFWTVSQETLSETQRIILLLLALVLAVVLIHPKVLGAIWARFSKEELEDHLTWEETAKWMILYVLSWVIGGLVLFCILNFVRPVSATTLITLIGIWSIAGVISLSGAITIPLIGLREISLVLMISPLVSPMVSLLGAILVRLVWLAGELLTSLIGLRL